MSDASDDPVVGIVMGSDSDWPMMEPAAVSDWSGSLRTHTEAPKPQRRPDCASAVEPKSTTVYSARVLAGSTSAARRAGR